MAFARKCESCQLLTVFDDSPFVNPSNTIQSRAQRYILFTLANHVGGHTKIDTSSSPIRNNLHVT